MIGLHQKNKKNLFGSFLIPWIDSLITLIELELQHLLKLNNEKKKKKKS